MALFPHARAGRVLRVPVGDIDPNPAQPRRVFDPAGIRELADSIAQNGLLCPISVRQVGKRYQLIAGERRLMAFRLLEEPAIPALLEQADDLRAGALALVENLQRRDLNFFEQAAAIANLIQSGGLTQRQAAERLGMSQPAVANKLRLLRLPVALLDAFAAASLTERHARALLPLSDDPRLTKAAERVLRERLTVTQTERLVDSLLADRPKTGSRLLILKDLRLFTSTISRAVEVMKEAGIQAETIKSEDDSVITYTIVIPKTAARRAPRAGSGQAV